MLSIQDVRHLKEMRFTKRHFSWTSYAFLRLNLIALVTVFLFEVGESFDVNNIIHGGIYIIGIATIMAITVVPLIDLYYFMIDRKICDAMSWDYHYDYIENYSTKQIEMIRANYKELIDKGLDNKTLRSEMNFFILN